MFSKGDRKMAANEEAISSLLRRVYRAMTEEMSPANNVEEELSRVFFFFFFFFFSVLVHSSLLCAINPRVNNGSNGSSGKKGRLRSTSRKETQLKKVRIVSLCYSSTTALRLRRGQHSFN